MIFKLVRTEFLLSMVQNEGTRTSVILFRKLSLKGSLWRIRATAEASKVF